MAKPTQDSASQLALGLGGETVVCFTEGLPGFENVRAWELVAHEDAQPFLWLRAADQPQVCLVVINPLNVAADYAPEFSAADLARVGLTPADPKVVLVVVSLHADRPTVNLRAPLVVNPERMLGGQIILEDARWPLRQPVLPIAGQ